MKKCSWFSLFRAIVASLVLGGVSASISRAQGSNSVTTAMPAGSLWRYYNEETAPGEGWKTFPLTSGFSGFFRIGAAQLGYGDGDEVTVTRTNSAPHPITAYFRREFVAGATNASALLRMVRDDGAVVYINGNEILRDGMPAGSITHETLAVADAGGDENAFREFIIPNVLLRPGTNAIAVEVHQVSASSSDLSFDLELTLSGEHIGVLPVVTIEATRAETSEPLPNALVVPAQFTLRRQDPRADLPLSVNLTYRGSAKSEDYEVLSTNIVFHAGENTATILVRAKSDDLFEGTEYVRADLYKASETFDPASGRRPYVPGLGTNSYAMIWIADEDSLNELPMVSINPRVAETTEMALSGERIPVLLELSRTQGLEHESVVSLAYGGTATPGADYERLPETVRFAPGRSSTNIVLFARGDTVPETNETVIARLILSSTGNYLINATEAEALVHIIDNSTNAPGRVRILKPAEGAQFPVGQPIQISAETIDPNGYMPRVEFYSGTNRIGVAEAGFSVSAGIPVTNNFVWNDAPAGSHTLTVRAKDSRQDTIVSEPIHITVVMNPPVGVIAIPAGSVWRYYNEEAAPPAHWNQFQLLGWAESAAELGYGDGDEVTVTRSNTVPSPISAYFQRQFFSGATNGPAVIRIKRDDGVVIYINGTEVLRDQMPSGVITHETTASSDAGENENTFHEFAIENLPLRAGYNYIYVEVHQASASSSDMSFDLELILFSEHAGVPTVTLEATVPQTSEPLPNAIVVPGEFTLRREDPRMDLPLYVPMQYSGSASPQDYEAMPTNVVFQPGQSAITIPVRAKSDDLIEGTEIIRARAVSLSSTANYNPVAGRRPFDADQTPAGFKEVVSILDGPQENTSRLRILEPQDGAVFPVGQPIQVAAEAIDLLSYIPRVEFYAGTNQIGVSQIDFVQAPPPGTPIMHSIVWSNAPAGNHVLTARGFSNRQFEIESRPIEIIVAANDRMVISVQALEPNLAETGTNGLPDQAYFRIRRVSGPTDQAITVTFTLAGTATYGRDYQPVPMFLTLGPNDLSEFITIVPISDALPEGNESIVLTLLTNGCGFTASFSLDPFAPIPSCYDVAPGMGSAEIIIHDFAANQPPTVAITAPHDGAVFSPGQFVYFRAEASDPDGHVVQINMLMDGRVIASTNTFILMNSTNPPPGEHTLQAIARDDGGATNVSQRVRILIRGTNDIAFFERQLPAGFTPGTLFTVRIQARVPSGTQAWGVEDLPPPGWSVSSISDGGTFDAATGKVKFGYFIEPGTRTLSYVVRPPAGDGGTIQFVGTFTGVGSIDGRTYPILGQSTVSSLASEFHPADRNEDRRIALAEVTGYAAAWKLGETWPAGPNPIPASYVTRAGLIWRQGEAYRFAATNPPPFCWISLAGREGVFVAGSASTATRSISGGPEPSSPRVVTLEVEPAASVTAYNVEERVPAGWTVQNITGDGVLDPVRGVVRWGLYLDSDDRTLSYQLVPPDGVAAGGQLLGEVTLDGEVLTFAGADSVVSVDPATPLRLQSTELTGDGGVKLKLGGAASQVCVLESSTDLASWESVAELFLPGGELEFRDSDVGEAQQRYYRLRAR